MGFITRQDIPNFLRISLSREGLNFIFHGQIQRNGATGGFVKYEMGN